MEECRECCRLDKNKLFAYVCFFLFGIIVGFFMAPIKKGICLGSYNGSYNKRTYLSSEEEEEDK